MPEQKMKYQRLSSRLYYGSRSSLWLGPDHLLYVEPDGYEEKYRRFFYRDIQAIVIQRTHGRRNTNIGLGLVVAGLLIVPSIAFWPQDSNRLLFFFVIAIAYGSPFWLMAIIQSLLGPTCAFHIRTAVQSEVVSSIRRLRRAERALQRIRPLIESTQGTLTPEMTAAAATAFAGPASLAPPVPAPAPVSATAHYVLHTLSVTMGVVYWIFQKKITPGIFWFSFVAMALIMTASIWALAQPAARKLGRYFTVLSIVDFVLCGVLGFAGYLAYMFWKMLETISPGAMGSADDIMAWLLRDGAQYLAILAPVFLALGLLGFLRLARLRAPFAKKFHLRSISLSVPPISVSPPVAAPASAPAPDNVPVGPPSGEP